MAIDIDKAERDRQIVLDERAGYDYRDNAERNGVSIGTVHNVLKKHVASVIKPAAEELVQFEIERLRNLWLALQPGIANGNVEAIKAGVRVSESLRKLTGVDAATKVEVEHTVTDQESRIAEMIRKTAQLNADESE